MVLTTQASEAEIHRIILENTTHPSILTSLYNKLNCQWLPERHPIGNGKRRPPLPALIIYGFQHWMRIHVLLNQMKNTNRAVIHSATKRPATTTSILSSPFPAAPKDRVVKRYAGHLERALESTAGRAEGIEEVPDIEGPRKELVYFRPKSTKTQLETRKIQAELDKEEAIGAEFKGSAHKRLAEENGELESRKKRGAEMQAELDSSRNKVKELRRLKSASS
ncbi:unnamed protein product [Tuber aestivum]|uniref:DUF7514 domain-containing protein n=1 Tax=Tuber aestivum TaxID=59557 RepID=A0A292PK90_9PEZI|nr:unnamed protein product [Tuber aestivum]